MSIIDGMAGHERRIAEAERKALRALGEIGREMRLARLDHDLSQRAAATAAGLTHTSWGRLERGEVAGASAPTLARACAVVGLDLQLRAYPGGSVLRDLAHVRLLERFHSRLGKPIRWRTEVPLPNPGDRRSWDGLALLTDIRIGVEAETRARDSQELQRRLAGKRRDGGVDHVILLLADTRHNRAFLHAAGPTFMADFPVPGPLALERLGRSQDPGGSAVVLLPLPRR